MQSNETSAQTTLPLTSPSLMTALFRAQEDAEQAVYALEKRGYSRKDVGILMSEETRRRFLLEAKPAQSAGAKAAEGAGLGSAVGGATGAILAGMLVVAAPILIPGIGLLVAGPIVAALSGAGAVGIAGGIVGSLIGLGIPENHAKIYDMGLREGGVLISVQPRTQKDADAISKDWAKFHAENTRF